VAGTPSAIPVTLLTDSGVENVNVTVDRFLFGGILKRVPAQVEIYFGQGQERVPSSTPPKPPIEGRKVRKVQLNELPRRNVLEVLILSCASRTGSLLSTQGLAFPGGELLPGQDLLDSISVFISSNSPVFLCRSPGDTLLPSVLGACVCDV